MKISKQNQTKIHKEDKRTPKIKQRSCNTCKYAIFKDEGYSNYTVENTAFHCFMKK
jgi:hypothetical protein